MRSCPVSSTSLLTALTLASVASWLTASVSHAAVSIGQVGYGGNGCAITGAGADVKFKKNGRLVVTFPDMQTELSNRSFERKACSVAIPVTVAATERLVITRPSIFGVAQLSAAASLVARSEIFIPGHTGPLIEKSVLGDSGKREFFYERLEESIALECGAGSNVRINTSLLAQKQAPDANGIGLLKNAAITLRAEPCAP